jgi:hypothetical protein
MVLFKSVVEIAIRSMPYTATELGPDRPRIDVMAVCRDPVRRDTGHHLRRSKERLGGSQVAMLTSHDIHQGAIAIDRAIQIPPLPAYSDVRLINVPAAAEPAFAFAFAPEILCWSRCELRLPLPYYLVGEDEPAGQKQLRQIPQAQLVAQPPEYHEDNEIARVLRLVQHIGAAFVELLAAPAAEPAIALCSPPKSFADRG